jgi:hypothetical protein
VEDNKLFSTGNFEFKKGQPPFMEGGVLNRLNQGTGLKSKIILKTPPSKTSIMDGDF